MGDNDNISERHGSHEFYRLLEEMAVLHDKKSHDYANNDNPFGNYRFAGMLSQLFKNPDDAGFIGRIGEKLYRLSNLENSGKTPSNESIEDTEIDICVITVLWIASRIKRRAPMRIENCKFYSNTTREEDENECAFIEASTKLSIRGLAEAIEYLKALRDNRLSENSYKGT